MGLLVFALNQVVRGSLKKLDRQDDTPAVDLQILEEVR